jgi:hypothetical protein
MAGQVADTSSSSWSDSQKDFAVAKQFIICFYCAQGAVMHGKGLCSPCYLKHYHKPSPTIQQAIDAFYSSLPKCNSCSTTLSSKKLAGGLCKPCQTKEYRSTRPFKDRMALRAREWRKNNPEKVKENNKKLAKYSAEWHKANKQRRNKAMSEHYKENKADYINKTRARRANLGRLIKTLPNEHKQAIINFYALCPPGYHVDHIVPLKGKQVSGLHVIYNLQYLPIQENLKKGNKFENAQP